jgi:hypothetical protein
VLEAQEFERRLEASMRDGGLLTLMAYPSDVSAAAAELRRFDPIAIDLDRLLIDRLHAVADELKVRWDLVLRADGADRSSQDWSRLTTLALAPSRRPRSSSWGRTGPSCSRTQGYSLVTASSAWSIACARPRAAHSRWTDAGCSCPPTSRGPCRRSMVKPCLR